MRNLILTVVCVLAGFAIVLPTVKAFAGSVNKVSNTLKVNR